MYMAYQFIVSCEECENDDIRLTDEGQPPNEGRVEICVDGEWGPICDRYNFWNEEAAAVVCRQLGLSPAGIIHH